MKMSFSLIGLVIFMLLFTSCKEHILYTDVNHPHIAYWFIDDSMLIEKKYKNKIDFIAENTNYDFLFLTARDGVDFYDVKKMKPILGELVNYAHSLNIKVGIQFWQKENYVVPIEYTERTIQESELLLDNNGTSFAVVKASDVQKNNHTQLTGGSKDDLLIKSELFSINLFKKISDGVYDKSTLVDFTNKAEVKAVGDSILTISIKAGGEFAGYTAYILTQHYYNFCTNFSDYSLRNLSQILFDYSDIDFDGVGIDEYRNLPIVPYWELENGRIFHHRLYSLPMADLYYK